MEYDHIKLTRDELEFVLEILQCALEDSGPSIALDIVDIIRVLREPIRKERRNKATEWHHNKQLAFRHKHPRVSSLEYCKHLDKVFLRYMGEDA